MKGSCKYKGLTPISRMKNVLKSALDECLKPRGFSKKSDTWYQRDNDLIKVVNLQKSQYGPQYYVNLAFCLNVLGTEQFPKEHQCHVRIRATSLPRADALTPAGLLDLECSNYSDEKRFGEMIAWMEMLVLPFLEKISTQRDLYEAIKRGDFIKGMILKKVKDLFLLPEN